jgi:hypothetical protein
MLHPVRAFLRTVALISVLSILGPPGVAAAARNHHKPPTQKQIKDAVRKAERSKQLWATVNVCDKPKFGIRAQMPALGFPTRMSMKIQVNYWNFVKQRFQPDWRARKKLYLGSVTKDLHQGGWVWQFTPVVILSGTVTFQWRYHHKVIGRVSKETAHGVKGVDFTDPKGHSTATCRFL